MILRYTAFALFAALLYVPYSVLAIDEWAACHYMNPHWKPNRDQELRNVVERFALPYAPKGAIVVCAGAGKLESIAASYTIGDITWGKEEGWAVGFDLIFLKHAPKEVVAAIAAHEAAHRALGHEAKCDRLYNEGKTTEHAACEHEADRWAAERVGVGTMIQAINYLQKFWREQTGKQESAYDVVIAERIRLLGVEAAR